MTGEAGEATVVVPNDKTGTLFTAVAHIFCAVVGAGVLGLPNAVAWLGWVAGPLCLIAFFAISLWSSLMLAVVYCVDGVEFSRYHHAVEHILGRKAAVSLAVFQCLNLVLVNIAFSITGAISMQMIAQEIGSSFDTEWQLMMVMSAIELVLSQLPSLEEIWWVSALGTVSSLAYVLIALILGLVYSGNHGGSIGGRAGNSGADKAFNMLNALGTIGFAYSFALVLLEIQDTLRQPPKAQSTMSKAVWIAITAAFGLYFSSALACYSALGNDVPGEVLQGFKEAPNWALVVANICIVIHMVTAWQVFAQPIFESIESWIKVYVIKKQQKIVGVAGEVVATEPEAEVKCGRPSPFEVARGPSSIMHQHQHQEMHRLPSLTEGPDLEGHGSALAPGLTSNSSLRRRMSTRSSAGLVVANSAPIPDLLPVGGWKRQERGSATSLASVDQHKESVTGVAPDLNRQSVMSLASSMLGSQAMYHLDTAVANEHVPLNDQGYFLPLWQRLVIRSAYVLLCTIVAVCVPFFSAITGLVGALMFWPLSIGFPFAMYAKVYKVGRTELLLMKVVAGGMLLVAAAATVASFRSILVSWSKYTFFS